MAKVQKVTRAGRVFSTPEDATRAGVAGGARTATANGTPFDTEDALAISATLAITAVAGTTPTLDVKLQESVDGTNWNDVGAFPQKTGSGTHGRTFGPLTPGSQCRWVWTIGGSAGPSFTFSIDNQAVRTGLGG
jgi:hypothetical protein